MPRRKTLSSTELKQYLRVIAPLRRGLDLLPEHVVITDEHANIVYANEAVGRATGFSPSDIIGKNPGDLWGGHMPRSVYRSMWRTIKMQKKPFSHEVKNRRKDGQIVWQDLRVSPILDAKRRVRFFIGVETHVTARKREEHFRDELLSVIGHDSLTPVTAIRWTIELLLEKGKLTSEQRDAIEEITRQNRRLFLLIEDMIFLSRLSGHPSKEKFDLIVEIQHLLPQLQEQFPGVDFLLEGALSSCALFTIRSLALELCAILLKNAAECMTARGGRVRANVRKKGNDIFFSCSTRLSSRMHSWRDRTFAEKIAQYLLWGDPSVRRRGTVITWSVRIPTKPVSTAFKSS